VGLAAALEKREKAPLALPLFLDHATELGRAHGFKTALLALRPLDFRAGTEAMMKRDREALGTLCKSRAVLFMDTYDAFPADGLPNEYIIYPGNSHPNATSHALYAKSAAEQLQASGILDDLSRRAATVGSR
jgi:hypothetical protein